MKSNKPYTAIYSTSTLNGVEYSFYADDIEEAIEFCEWKFKVAHIAIRDEQTQEIINIVK